MRARGRTTCGRFRCSGGTDGSSLSVLGGGGVSGALSQRLTRDGSLVEVDESEVLDAGTYTLELSFTPGNGNRYLPATGQRVVTVAKRTVTVTPVNRFKLVGDPDPAFTAVSSGLLAGDAGIELDEPIGVGRAPGQAGEAVGQYAIRSTGGGHKNYAFEHEDGILYVGAVSVDTPADGELDRDDPITCACEGLAPGMEVSVSLFSHPVLLGTDTVDADGECPLLAGLTIPDDFPGGEHDLVILIEDGDADALDGPITLSSAVTVSDPSQGDDSDDGADDDGFGGRTLPPAPNDPVTTVDPTAGTDTSPTPESESGLLSELNPPSVPAGDLLVGNGGSTSSDSRTPPGGSGGTRSGTGPGSVRIGGAGVGDGTRITMDLGPRGGTTDIAADASFAAVVAASRAFATVGLDELAQESFRGFAPGTGIRIEVIGARSSARFVLTEVDLVDAFVAARVLSRSAEFQAADFARITDIRPVESLSRSTIPAWTSAQREDANDQFAASRLSQPVMLADVDVSRFTQWVQVSGEVAGYLPGSTVHLAATSEPVVLASAVVQRDGTATISGALPVELLGLGEHRIRFVGTRVFDGLSVDGDGEIQLSAEVLAEIDRFDRGTDATVIVYGLNGAGGSHVSLRIVPLDPNPPWWTLLVVIAVGALGLRARRRGRLQTTWRQGATVSAVLVATVPAIVLGWFATTTIVAVVGGVVALLLAVAVPVVQPRTEDPAEIDGLDDQDLVDLQF